MKHYLIALALVATATTSAAAQTPVGGPQPASNTTQPAPPPAADRRAQRLAKELNLSAEQQAKLVPILQAQRQEMQAMRQQAGSQGRQPGQGREMKAAQEKYLTQIKAVLSPEQYTKFLQLQEQQRNTMRERRQRNAQGGPEQD